MRFKQIRRLILGCAVIASGAASGYQSGRPTPAEMAALPPFCPVRFAKDSKSPQYKAMERQYGTGNFLHFHHLCMGLNWQRRAVGISSRQDKERAYLDAKGNYEYIVRHTERNFFMRPLVYVELGKVLLELKNPGEALKHFTNAVEFDPKFREGYVQLIEFYTRVGERKEALKWATAGLRNVPGDSYLQKAYLAAGGKEPFPEPLAKLPETPGNADLTASPAAGTAETSASDGPLPERPADASEGVGVPESGCRFCPPKEVQKRWESSFK